MRVSFIVPMYNSAPYIEECARSLFEQTFDSCEFIFVDDASSDNSSEIVMELLEGEFEPLKESVKLIRHASNLGVSEARNTALKVARGQFVIFVDSDDWCDPELAESLIIEQLLDDSDIVTCDYFRVSSSGTHHGCRTPHLGGRLGTLSIITSQSFHYPNRIWGMLIRRKLLVDNKISFDPRISMGEDFLFLVQLYHSAHKVFHLWNRLYYYRDGAVGSAMQSLTTRHCRSYVRAAIEAKSYLQSCDDAMSHRYALRLLKRNVRRWVMLREGKGLRVGVVVFRVWCFILNILWTLRSMLKFSM